MVHGIGSAATRSISINRDTEDVSRCSLSKIYIYMYARVPSWLSKKVVYIELIFISFTLAKREEENKVRVFFFFHHWNLAVVEIRLFISFLFSFGSCYYSYVKYRLINRLADNLGHVSYETTTSGPIFATWVLFLSNESHISLYDNRFIKTANCSF